MADSASAWYRLDRTSGVVYFRSDVDHDPGMDGVVSGWGGEEEKMDE